MPKRRKKRKSVKRKKARKSRKKSGGKGWSAAKLRAYKRAKRALINKFKKSKHGSVSIS